MLAGTGAVLKLLDQPAFGVSKAQEVMQQLFQQLGRVNAGATRQLLQQLFDFAVQRLVAHAHAVIPANRRIGHHVQQAAGRMAVAAEEVRIELSDLEHGLLQLAHELFQRRREVAVPAYIVKQLADQLVHVFASHHRFVLVPGLA